MLLLAQVVTPCKSVVKSSQKSSYALPFQSYIKVSFYKMWVLFFAALLFFILILTTYPRAGAYLLQVKKKYLLYKTQLRPCSSLYDHHLVSALCTKTDHSKPHVVILPGVLADKYSWLPFVNAIRCEVNVTIIDIYNTIDSYHQEYVALNRAQLSKLVLHVLKELHITQFHLVTHGASNLVAENLKHAARYSSSTLMSTTLINPFVQSDRVNPIVQHCFTVKSLKDFKWVVNTLFARNPFSKSLYRDAYAIQYSAENSHRFDAFQALMKRQSSVLTDGSSDAQVWVIEGDSDPLNDNTDKYANTPVQRFSNCGHFAYVEYAEKTAFSTLHQINTLSKKHNESSGS